YGNGILSLGSFWYPSLAVRREGRWIDQAPEGLGDVAFAEMSDYLVSLRAPQGVKIAAPGARAAGAQGMQFEAFNVRDFAVLMSEDYQYKSKSVDVGGRPVLVEAFTTQASAAKAEKSIDIAARALQIYARRFGPYPYDRFIVAEGPMRAGAGGMEYSGMTAIASMLYGDWAKQLAGLSQALTGGLAGGQMGDLLGDLENEAFGDGTKAAPKAAPNAPAVQREDVAAPETDNPAMDFLQSTLGQQKAVLETLLEATIAHEVAHQWWAIGVGSDSIRAPWVDESLTNYSAMIYFEDRYGKEAAQQMIDLHLKTPYSMGRMLGNADAPVNLKTAAYSGNVQYGAIVYGKGALFYEALRRTVGDEAFFASLREYYGTYRSRLSDAGSLLQIFQKHAPNRTPAIRALYQRWILEAHGDEDITGGKPMGVEDLLGSMLGGSIGTE
ncbi:MAG: hypothetical protein JWN98_1053, partial [Abditibacteriota bacterium]|nr:hypothetical protein [Abditibacteriota bacterium]